MINKSIIYEEHKQRGDAGERYSLCHNNISRGAGLDGVSACRTLWFASIYDLLVVSQEYGSHYSVVGKNLHGFWHHAFSAIRRRRFTGFSDWFTKEAPGTMVKIEWRATSRSVCFNWQNVKKPPEAASHGCASGGFAYESNSNCGASVTVRRYSSGSPFKINSA